MRAKRAVETREAVSNGVEADEKTGRDRKNGTQVTRDGLNNLFEISSILDIIS